MKIVIDAGHGGWDPGAVGPGGTREADLTWEWAKSCRFLLRQEGFEVDYTHVRDSGIWTHVRYPNRLRPRIANNHKACFLCLHFNAVADRSADYTYVLFNRAEGGADCALVFGQQLAAVTGNSLKTAHCPVVNERGSGLILPVEKVALLLEPCFLSTPSREEWLTNHDHIIALARAVATACAKCASKLS